MVKVASGTLKDWRVSYEREMYSRPKSGHNVADDLLLSENKLEECEASLEQALRIAREQQAKSLELRAATSLARL